MGWSVEAATGLRALTAGELRWLALGARLLLVAYFAFVAFPVLAVVGPMMGWPLVGAGLTVCLMGAAMVNALGMYCLPLDWEKPGLTGLQLAVPMVAVVMPLVAPARPVVVEMLAVLLAFAPCPLLTFPRFRRAAVAIAHLQLADSCAEVGPGLSAPLFAGTLPSLPVVMGLVPPAEVAILLAVADVVLLMFAMTFFLLFYLYGLYALGTAAREFGKAARRRAGIGEEPAKK